MTIRAATFGIAFIVLVGVILSWPLFSKDRKIRLERSAGDEAYSRGDSAAAEKHYQAAFALAKQAGVETDSFIFTSGDLAKLYSSEKKNAEAEALFRQRLSVAERLWIEKPELLCLVYDDLAMFYLSQDRYEEAHPLYLKALDLRVRAFGANSKSAAQGFEFYGALLKAKQHEQEGMEMEAKAKKIRGQGSQ